MIVSEGLSVAFSHQENNGLCCSALHLILSHLFALALVFPKEKKSMITCAQNKVSA